jgi:hypothetical protein
MKLKLLNTALILSSLIAYLEWGTSQASFLAQVELELISKLFTNPLSVLHPFTVLPLLGQILLLITLFQNKVSSKITYIGIACLGILLLFIGFVGCIGLNYKIILSVLPFISISIFTIHSHKRHKSIDLQNSK